MSKMSATSGAHNPTTGEITVTVPCGVCMGTYPVTAKGNCNAWMIVTSTCPDSVCGYTQTFKQYLDCKNAH